MNAIDAISILLLCVGALWGFLHGVIRQITTFVSWVVAVALVYLFSSPVAHLISDEFDAPYTLAYVVAVMLLGVVGQVISRLGLFIIRSIIRRFVVTVRGIGEDEETKEELEKERFQGSFSDRAIGAFVGAGKWAVLIWIMLSGVALVLRPLQERGHLLGVSQSELYQQAYQHNAFALIWKQDLERLDSALKRLNQKQTVQGPRQQAAADALAKDGRIQKLMQDGTIQNAFRQGNIRALLESPELLSVITDPALMEQAIVVAGAPLSGALTGGQQ